MPNGMEEWRISKVEEMARQHDQDLYRGNGKPGLTTRMQRAEDSIETIKFYGRWLLVTAAGIIVVGVLNLVLKH